MTVLKLTCDPADDRLWTLDGVGTLRRTGRTSRAAAAEAGGRSALWLGAARLSGSQ